MSIEEEDTQVRRNLKTLAKFIDDNYMPYGWGFIVLAFPFGDDGRMNYIASAERADVVRAMYEFIEATKERFGEHIAEEGAGAYDEQLGRARQRVAELEREIELLKTRIAPNTR